MTNARRCDQHQPNIDAVSAKWLPGTRDLSNCVVQRRRHCHASASRCRKNVPVVTVESFYRAHGEKLQLKLEGKRGRLSSQNSRADDQSSRASRFPVSIIISPKSGSRSSARPSNRISPSLSAEDPHPAVPRIVRAKNSLPRRLAGRAPRAALCWRSRRRSRSLSSAPRW